MVLLCGDEALHVCMSQSLSLLAQYQKAGQAEYMQNCSVVENLMETAVRFCAQLLIEPGSLNACVREKESMRVVSTLFPSLLFF